MAIISQRRRIHILARDDYRCAYCGRCAPDAVLHVDHIAPRSKGGSDEDDNLVTACGDCNFSKNASENIVPPPRRADCIPQVIRDLLRYRWRAYSVYSEHIGFTDADRHHRPSYYLVRPSAAARDYECFSYVELKRMADEGVLAGCISPSGVGKNQALNEHASHAIQEFLAKTQNLWAECVARLDAAAIKQPPQFFTFDELTVAQSDAEFCEALEVAL